MADGISIPGVTDRYKTNDLVESLMEVERVPLKREQATLERYQKQQDAWRDLNARMSTLRTSVKNLYSFENPFNNKLASSSDESAITVDAGREADFGSFQIDVLNPATADRFLSDSISADMQVEQGSYIFKSGEKSVDFNWKGGKLADFVTALNRRAGDIIQARLIGVSSSKKALLVESLKTGAENRLSFEKSALSFARQIGMIQDAKDHSSPLLLEQGDLKNTQTKDAVPQEHMPALSADNVSLQTDQSGNETIKVLPRGGFEFTLPAKLSDGTADSVIEFSFSTVDVEDITGELNAKLKGPVLPDAESVNFSEIEIYNEPSETLLEGKTANPFIPLQSITDDTYFYLRNSYGIETELEPDAFDADAETGITRVSVRLKDYPEATTLIVRNGSTGKELNISGMMTFDYGTNLGFEPSHAISTASDAQIRYEGITMTRPTNDIDDVVPHITLHLHNATDKTATINIEPDTEAAKDALITFVGNYNQVMAELNILTINKPEIISELDYLSSSEKEAESEKLGMFQGDFSLTNGKTALQRAVASSYSFTEGAVITQLSQLGISTNASGGGGYSASQMRGYLEIDEKKLDAALQNDLGEIRNMFGYDTDGDRVIDSGIAFQMDKQLGSWVQSGGIINSKTTALDTQIKSSNQRITRLETQLKTKEAELRKKYASMEGSLNSLEGQSDYLNNYTNSLNNRGR